MEKEVKDSLINEMGFEEALVNAAYQRAPIKTIEGVLNYID
jgi:hypothetical protein